MKTGLSIRQKPMCLWDKHEFCRISFPVLEQPRHTSLPAETGQIHVAMRLREYPRFSSALVAKRLSLQPWETQLLLGQCLQVELSNCPSTRKSCAPVGEICTGLYHHQLLCRSQYNPEKEQILVAMGLVVT